MSSYHAGSVVILDPDAPTLEMQSFQCKHCNKIVIVEHKGNAHSVSELRWDGNIPQPNGTPKKRRGFCFNCMGPTCGEGQCVRCVPWEAKLEAAEGSRRFWHQYKLVSR